MRVAWLVRSVLTSSLPELCAAALPASEPSLKGLATSPCVQVANRERRGSNHVRKELLRGICRSDIKSGEHLGAPQSRHGSFCWYDSTSGHLAKCRSCSAEHGGDKGHCGRDCCKGQHGAEHSHAGHSHTREGPPLISTFKTNKYSNQKLTTKICRVQGHHKRPRRERGATRGVE